MNFSAEKIIESFYRAVSNRAPDKNGMKAHLDRLKSDRSALLPIAQDLFDSEERMALLGGAAA